MTDYMAYLDTGFSREETVKIISNIYKEIKKYTIFDYILLRNEAHEGTYNVD